MNLRYGKHILRHGFPPITNETAQTFGRKNGFSGQSKYQDIGPTCLERIDQLASRCENPASEAFSANFNCLASRYIASQQKGIFKDVVEARASSRQTKGPVQVKQMRCVTCTSYLDLFSS